MAMLYWPCLAAAILSIGFTDTHTDETPVILGFLLIVSGVLGIAFPAQFVTTGLTMGIVLFVTETLVGYGVLHAPWPAVPGIHWAPLVGLIPALTGAGAGAAIRRVAAKTASV